MGSVSRNQAARRLAIHQQVEEHHHPEDEAEHEPDQALGHRDALFVEERAELGRPRWSARSETSSAVRTTPVGSRKELIRSMRSSFFWSLFENAALGEFGGGHLVEAERLAGDIHGDDGQGHEDHHQQEQADDEGGCLAVARNACAPGVW